MCDLEWMQALGYNILHIIGVIGVAVIATLTTIFVFRGMCKAFGCPKK